MNTTSGTNNFHGRLFEYFRNQVLNSNGSWTFTLPRLAAGHTYHVTARYAGDTVDQPSQSAPVSLRVVRQGTVTSVTAGDTGADRPYPCTMRTLYMVTSGAADPTRASIPLHLAVNGSVEVGHTVGVVLAGDATELVKGATRESMAGVGLPPMRDLFAKAGQHGIPVYV